MEIITNLSETVVNRTFTIEENSTASRINNIPD